MANDEYELTANRIHAYEPYGPVWFHISDDGDEPWDLPFGFTNIVEVSEDLDARQRWERWFE